MGPSIKDKESTSRKYIYADVRDGGREGGCLSLVFIIVLKSMKNQLGDEKAIWGEKCLFPLIFTLCPQGVRVEQDKETRTQDKKHGGTN